MEEKPLTRDEVRSVIRGQSTARRAPFYIHFWVHPRQFKEREPLVHELLARYPVDFQLVPFNMPSKFRNPNQAVSYSWLPYEDPNPEKNKALDAAAPLPEWDRLDEVLAAFPDPMNPVLLAPHPHPDFARLAAPGDGRYRLGHWWYCLFERHWELRGMTNALTDYYTYPDEVHRLFHALTDFYVKIIERAGKEGKCDGIMTSDDLGTQTGPFFSPDIFRAFFKPYYKEMTDCAHANGMDFWMHACGCVKPFIPDWIETGLDVLHPIQKHTMDERKIATQFGHRLTFFAGLDVQQVIPWGTPEEVRAEVRHLLDTFWRPGEGRCILTAGNGINQDCTLESLDAFFDEALQYGTRIVRNE